MSISLEANFIYMLCNANFIAQRGKLHKLRIGLFG